jgi:hypothetical protein
MQRLNPVYNRFTKDLDTIQILQMHGLACIVDEVPFARGSSTITPTRYLDRRRSIDSTHNLNTRGFYRCAGVREITSEYLHYDARAARADRRLNAIVSLWSVPGNRKASLR